MKHPLDRRVLLAAALLAACTGAAAQAPEARLPPLIRIVVPFPPGGSNDVLARALAPLLAKRLDTNVVVENKAGAAGVIGSDAVAKGPRDGSMLLLTSASLLTAAATQSKLPYDTLTAFAPVAMIGKGPLLVAAPPNAFKSQAEFLAAARAKPGVLNYGTSGVGSIAHLASELLNARAGVQTAHVPYKGASEALLGLMSGQIQLMISNYSSVSAQLKAGKLVALAVTSPTRSAAFPDLPPVADAVPGYAVEIWTGVLAPAGTPAAIVQRLNREINELATSAELRHLLEPDGATPTRLEPAGFAAHMKDELAQWKRIASDRRISID